MNGSIDSETDEGVCTITLRNEGTRNAINYSMAQALIDKFESLEDREDCPVVVLRGAGDKAFSAGLDLDSGTGGERTPRQKRLWTQMTSSIEGYTYPVIGMINGDTFGGAVEVAASCDIRIGVKEARFALTPAKVGLIYEGHALSRIMNLVGPAKTKELVFTANSIDGVQAKKIGLLNHVVTRTDLQERTYGIADDIVANAPLSIRAMKEITNVILEKGYLSEAEIKWTKRIGDQAFESKDHAEGVAAFKSGRKPEFEDC